MAEADTPLDASNGIDDRFLALVTDPESWGGPAWVSALEGLFGGSAFLILAVVFWRCYAFWLSRVRKNEDRIKELGPIGSQGREADWVTFLQMKTIDGGWYRTGLSTVMDRVDGRLGAHPFSPGLYTLCTLLALAYPIVAMLVVWVGTGANTSGVSGLLPEATAGDERLLSRMIFGVGAGLAVLGGWQGVRQSGWRSIAWLGIMLLGFLLAFAGAFAFALAVAGAGAGAVAVAVAVRKLISSVTAAAGVSRAHLAAWVFLVILTVTGVVVMGRWGAGNEVSNALLVFFAALPLVNAVLDWGSIGITRLLLRRAASSESIAVRVGLGVADAVIALMALIVLTVAMVGAVRGLNALHLGAGGTAPLADIGAVLDRIHADPGNPAVWWVYVTLFSTLLPSVLHLIAALAWVLTPRLFRKTRQAVGLALRRGDGYQNPLDAEKLARQMAWLEIAKWGLPAGAVTGFLTILLGHGFFVIPWVGGHLLTLAYLVAGLTPPAPGL